MVQARRRTAREWRVLVEAWERSGMSRQAFARSRGLNPTTLGWWRWKLQEDEPPAHGFLEVVLDDEAAPAGPAFTVEIGPARILVPHDFDEEALRRLVGALC